MKTMLVTGAANGIGRAIAHAANSAGYRVGLLDTDIDSARQVAAEMSDAIVVEADVREVDQVEQALEAIVAIDIVVNNAGILRTGPLIEHDVDDFRLVMDVNLNAVFIVAQAAAKRMRDRTDGNSGGVIINMSSINGIHPSPNCGA